MLGDRDKGVEVVSGEEKKYFVLGRLEQPMQNKNFLYRHDKPKEPTKEEPYSFVLFESLFTSVSTIEIDTLEYQQTEKIETELRDVDNIRIRKVYACCPRLPSGGS